MNLGRAGRARVDLLAAALAAFRRGAGKSGPRQRADLIINVIFHTELINPLALGPPIG